MAQEVGIEFEPVWGVGKIIIAFDKFVEEKLIQPVFITEYPKEISPSQEQL